MKNVLLTIAAICCLTLGVGAYIFTETPGAGVKSVITYDVKQGTVVTATKIRTQNKNWNFSEETTYINTSPEPNKIQDYVCIVGNGLYKVDHIAGGLSYMSKCQESYRSQAAAEASPNYVSTSTFLGYTVVIQSNDGLTTYYSPALQTVLKYDLGDGKVIEATNVTTTGVPTVALPAYSVTDYDEYKISLTDQLEAEMITQTEYDTLYAEIPSQFQ